MNLRNYKYEAKNAEGKPIKGRIEAINRGTAIKFLQMKGLKVINLKEYKNILTTINQISIGSLLNTKQLVNKRVDFFEKSILNCIKKCIMGSLYLRLLRNDRRNSQVY